MAKKRTRLLWIAIIVVVCYFFWTQIKSFFSSIGSRVSTLFNRTSTTTPPTTTNSNTA